MTKQIFNKKKTHQFHLGRSSYFSSLHKSSERSGLIPAEWNRIRQRRCFTLPAPPRTRRKAKKKKKKSAALVSLVCWLPAGRRWMEAIFFPIFCARKATRGGGPNVSPFFLPAPPPYGRFHQFACWALNSRLVQCCKIRLVSTCFFFTAAGSLKHLTLQWAQWPVRPLIDSIISVSDSISIECHLDKVKSSSHVEIIHKMSFG